MQTNSYIRMNSTNNNESRTIRTPQKTNIEYKKKKITLYEYNKNKMFRYNFVKFLALFNNI